jgi:hypothetical protein
MSYLPRLAVVSVAMLVVAASSGLQAEQSKPEANGITVTVKYTGKGAVDSSHRLWVWLFDNPKIGPDSFPIGELSIEKNGGAVTFPNLSAKEVYIAMAYDEGGGFLGQAPPPPGSPIALYGAKGPDAPPLPVTPGPKVKVVVTFDDSQRMP